MKSQFSKSWKSSVQPRKQRKFRQNAPSHLKSKLAMCTLSTTLKEKYKKRSARVVKGDKVKIMRGQFKGRSGKVERVDVTHDKVLIAGIELEKKDGSKSFYPIHPSNLMITELKTDDKKRVAALKRK